MLDETQNPVNPDRSNRRNPLQERGDFDVSIWASKRLQQSIQRSLLYTLLYTKTALDALRSPLRFARYRRSICRFWAFFGANQAITESLVIVK